MRKAILAFLVFASLASFAGKKHQYTFDFSQPGTLSPQIVFGQDVSNVQIGDYTFSSTDGAVQLKFVRTSTGGGLGASIDTRIVDGRLRYHLDMPRGTQMYIRGDYVQLDSLEFSSDSYPGGLYLNSPQDVGVVSPFSNWYSRGASGVKELHYVQNGHNPYIYGITVYYTSPQNILSAVSPLTSETYKTTGLKRFVITYNKKVKLTDTPSFTLSSNQLGFVSPALTATVNPANEMQVIVTLADGSVFETMGVYNLIIGENSIVTDDEDGYYNPKLVYPITIVESFAKFNMLSVTPDTVDVDEIPNNITLTFPGQLRFREYPSNEILRLVDHDGNTVRRMKANYADETYKTVQLEFQDGQTAAVKQPGLYTITIPEGLIWNNEYAPEKADSGKADGARHNATIELIYNIGKQVYASEAKLQEARQWLAKTGPGTPAADSESRQILEQMVAREIGTDEKFTDSIAAFIQETDIELPATNKYYRVYAESSDGKRVYLACRNDSIVLTTDVSEAVSLKATVNDDRTVTLQTIDGLYLHQLQSAEGYQGTTPRNATRTYSADICNLKLAHLDIEGVDSLAAFGLMTVYGSLGQNLNGDTKEAYALIDVSKPSVETNWEYTPRFTSTLTSAFRMEQTEKPAPVLSYVLNPADDSRVDTMQYVYVKFNTDLPVSIAENAKAQLTRSTGLVINSSAITAVEGEANSFKIRFEDVPAGYSTVTIPEGAFTFVDEGRTLPTKAMTTTFYVLYGMDFQYDLNEVMQFYVLGANLGLQYVRDVDLNNFVYYTDKPYTFGISSKRANLVLLTTGHESVVNTGYFEQIEDFAHPGYEGCGAMRLVFDEPITEGSLEAGEYLIDIFEGTFGDANFAKYLADPTSVSKRSCHVNRNAFFVLRVDNEKAAEQEKVYPSAETLAKAESILSKSGVGYPNPGSAARQALSQLAATKEGSDAEYNTLIDGLLADGDIELPADGKYYKVEGVSQNGSVYLQYADQKLQLTTDAANATAFKVEYVDGQITMHTVDGLYLKGLSEDGIVSEGTPGVKFARLLTYGVDAEATYGLICINDTSKVNVITRTFATTTLLEYGTAQTSYFRLTEVDERDVVLPEATYAVVPAAGQVAQLDKIVLTFSSNGTVSVKNPTTVSDHVKFAGRNTGYEVTTPLTVSIVNGKLEMTFINLPADTYTLTIDEGTFMVDYYGRTADVQAISVEYVVTEGEKFNVVDYVANGDVAWKEDPKGEYIMDSDLNTITLVSQKPISVNTYQEVEIVEVAKGRFGKAVANADGTYSTSLQLYAPIVKGSHPEGTFNIVIPEGTFGDQTYGQYLLQPRGVLKSACQVNAAIVLTAKVSNTIVGITDVSADSQSSPVYDLMGRRVSGQLVPGQVYVRDGRKFTFRR